MADKLWMTLHVGIIPIEVYLSEMDADEDGECKGAVIRINRRLGPERRFSTLVHESIHCVLAQCGWQKVLEDADIEEEPLVAALEHGLIQMLGKFIRRPR